jgi:hypothetical protein
VTVSTVSLCADVDRTTANVLTRSHWLQVERIHARPVSAKMVDVATSRNVAKSLLIRKSMSHDPATTDAKTTVPVGSAGGLPFPAVSRVAHVNLRPEALQLQ